jgi:cardiolipin synthase A/B
MRPNFKLILPRDYVIEATAMIRNAQTRVALLVTTLVEGGDTDELVNALCAAANRGVAISVGVDTFTYTELQGSYIPTTMNSKRLKAAQLTEKRLRDAGVQFNWLGRFSTLAYAGRTHIKWCVIDNTVFCFGGVNLDYQNMNNIDYMFRVKNEALADRLSAEHERIIRADQRGHAYRSLKFGDDDNMVLIDGGFFGDSIIYRRACYWTERAKSVTLVSQYCPTGRLARLLKRSDAKLYFNDIENAKAHSLGLLNRSVIRIGMTFSGLKTVYTRKQYLHAKFMIFILKDGSKVAITGSHNFVRGGALLGTREVALETTNKKIIKQLEVFHKTYVK